MYRDAQNYAKEVVAAQQDVATIRYQLLVLGLRCSFEKNIQVPVTLSARLQDLLSS